MVAEILGGRSGRKLEKALLVALLELRFACILRLFSAYCMQNITNTIEVSAVARLRRKRARDALGTCAADEGTTACERNRALLEDFYKESFLYQEVRANYSNLGS